MNPLLSTCPDLASELACIASDELADVLAGSSDPQALSHLRAYLVSELGPEGMLSLEQLKSTHVTVDLQSVDYQQAQAHVRAIRAQARRLVRVLASSSDQEADQVEPTSAPAPDQVPSQQADQVADQVDARTRALSDSDLLGLIDQWRALVGEAGAQEALSALLLEATRRGLPCAQDVDVPSQALPQVLRAYSSDLIGRTGTTRHGERIRATGPAIDPARVSVVPIDLEGMDQRYVETFTPQVAHVVWDGDAGNQAQPQDTGLIHGPGTPDAATEWRYGFQPGGKFTSEPAEGYSWRATTDYQPTAEVEPQPQEDDLSQGSRVRHLGYGDRGTISGQTDGRPLVTWDQPTSRAAQEDTIPEDLENIDGLEAQACDQGSPEIGRVIVGVEHTSGRPVIGAVSRLVGPGMFVSAQVVPGSTFAEGFPVYLDYSQPFGMLASGPAIDPRHASTCPVRRDMAQCLEIIRYQVSQGIDPAARGEIGALEEYGPGGDQEGEVCTCGLVEDRSELDRDQEPAPVEERDMPAEREANANGSDLFPRECVYCGAFPCDASAPECETSQDARAETLQAMRDQAAHNRREADQANAETFAHYLRARLIPDLRDSGMNATADDFETCIAHMLRTSSSTSPARDIGRGFDGQGIGLDDLAHVEQWAHARAMNQPLEPYSDPTPQHVHARAFNACRDIRAYLEACPLASRVDLPQDLRTEPRAVHIFG